MAWPKGVRAVKGPATFLSLIAIALANGNTLGKEIVPVGPELASREIGVLLKGYPMLTQQNPLAPQGVGVILWGCEYQVGRAMITITITTEPSDPMPCKRKVAFGGSPQKSPKE